MWETLKQIGRLCSGRFALLNAPQCTSGHIDYQAIYRNLGIGLYRANLDGQYVSANPALVKLYGHSSEKRLAASGSANRSKWYVDPNRYSEFCRLLMEAGSVENFISEVYRHQTGEKIWVLESAKLVRNARTYEPEAYEGTVQEITDTYRRLECEERYRKLAAEVPGCLYEYRRRPDGTAHFPYMSEGVIELFGLYPADLYHSDKGFWHMVHPDDYAGFVESGLKCVRDSSNWSHEFRIICKDGSIKWIHGNSSIDCVADGSMVWYGFMTDITGRKLVEAKIRELAYYDPLTGLPNRRLLLDRLAMSLERSERSGSPGVLLFIDLNDFKSLNDTYGHDAGDKLLQEVARLLTQLMRSTDSVARLGGDEFVIIADELPNCEESCTAITDRLCQQVRETVSVPCQIAGHMLSFSASVGASLFHGRQAGAEEILSRADLRMYAAKSERGAGNKDKLPAPQKTASLLETRQPPITLQ